MADMMTRPVIMGTRGVVTSGHYLATAAGFRSMEQGGNAIDAAAAMCFCLNLLEPQSNGIGGEAPTLIYSSRENRTFAISGMGCSPKAFTIEWCRENGIDEQLRVLVTLCRRELRADRSSNRGGELFDLR